MSQKLTTEFYQQTAEELNTLFNGCLDKVSKEKGISKEQSFQDFFRMEREAVSKPSSLDSDRVSTTPTSDSERVNEIPRVATLRQSSTDVSSLETLMEGMNLIDRHSVKSFENQSTAKGIEAMDIMIRSGSLSTEEIQAIHDFLIKDSEALGQFLLLNGESADVQNAQFELFLSIMDLDILNTSTGQGLLHRIVDFAFSPTRFEWIQLQDNDIDSEINQKLLQYEASIRSKDIRGDIATLKSRSFDAYEGWMQQRMGGSTTITTPSSTQQAVTANWIKAEKKMEEKAQGAGNFSFGTVQIIHKILAAKDSDVKNPGQLRNRRAKSSMARLEYPTHSHDLHEKASAYERWLNTQMGPCERGEKSVIITAAQAYQRLVSLHPFENGNGRISRLMMDFVLERFGLPPAALGKDVLDAVYALNPKSGVTGKTLVNKVLEGIKISHQTIQE